MDAVWSALQGEHGTGHAFASGMGSGSGPQALGGATRRGSSTAAGGGRAVRVWSVELFTPSRHRVRCHCAWPPVPAPHHQRTDAGSADTRPPPGALRPEASSQGVFSLSLWVAQGSPGPGRGRFCPGQHLCQGPVCSGQQWGWDHEEGLQNAHPAWLGWHGGHVTPTFNSGTRAERLQTLSATVTLGRKLLPGPGPPRIREARGAWGGCGSAEPPQLKVTGETRAPSPWGGHPGGLQGRAGPGAHGREPGTADMQG